MAQNISLSTELSQNIDLLHRLLPLGKSFDLITRDLRSVSYTHLTLPTIA